MSELILDASPRLAIGVDVGGTQVRAALVDSAGLVHRRGAVRTDTKGGPSAVVAQIAQLVAEVAGGLDLKTLAGVGVCAPGPLDGPAGVVLNIPTLPGWVDVPISAWLAESLGVEVILENDGISAAIGEWHFGAGRGLSDFVYVTVSTGIGGGVVSDGHVLRGRRGMAGHLGHMTTAPEGEVCSCGNRGCWEAQASGTALAQMARRLATGQSGSALARIGESMDARHVIDAARAGDELANELVAREARLLGIGIVNLLHMYSPMAVVMGGGVSNGFDLLHPGIVQQVRERALLAYRDVPIVAAQLEQNAGLVGAACLAFFRSDSSAP